jgi:tetratricopeptide (TPR) repeat protein
VTETFETMVRAAAELRRAGRVPEAIAAYKALLARWPEKPDSWYNLALLQRQAGEFDSALASYQQALERGVSKPEEVHLNRSVIYADHLRRDEDAERELNTALALNPNYVPAILNLGNLREDQGRRYEASNLYEQALALDSRNHLALARFANLASVTAQDDPIIARLRHAIADPMAGPAGRAELGFVLGKLLDTAGLYDAAFDAYKAANRASRDFGKVRYDRAGHERLIDDIIRTFTPEMFGARKASQPSPSVFICGMFRSGSTLVDQVVASHPRVTSGGELNFIPEIVRSDLSPFPSAITRTLPERFSELAARYREGIRNLFPDADVITDKRPDNFLYLGLIKLLFPDAKIVHTVRDPLDNCLSVYFLHLDHRMAYALDLADIGHYYTQYRRLMAHWKALFGADIFDFDYDAFVHQPRPAVEKLLAFCGLEWDERCLAFHETPSTVKTASVWQVREPLYTRSSGRARHYERHLGPLRAQLGFGS